MVGASGRDPAARRHLPTPRTSACAFPPLSTPRNVHELQRTKRQPVRPLTTTPEPTRRDAGIRDVASLACRRKRRGRNFVPACAHVPTAFSVPSAHNDPVVGDRRIFCRARQLRDDLHRSRHLICSRVDHCGRYFSRGRVPGPVEVAGCALHGLHRRPHSCRRRRARRRIRLGDHLPPSRLRLRTRHPSGYGLGPRSTLDVSVSGRCRLTDGCEPRVCRFHAKRESGAGLACRPERRRPKVVRDPVLALC